MNDAHPLLCVQGVSKSFKNNPVVRDLSFNVNRGEVVGLLGPNGAGKSTTMRLITGYLKPDSGDILFNQLPLAQHLPALSAQIGYLAEGAPLWLQLTVVEHLHRMAILKRIANPRPAIANVIDQTLITNVLTQRIEQLSKGYRRRVALAAALLGDPPLLIMDEPTDGLDPNQKQVTYALIRNLAKERAVMISTHALEEAQTLTNRVIVMAKGQILQSGNIHDLIQQQAPTQWFFALTTGASATTDNSAPHSDPHADHLQNG